VWMFGGSAMWGTGSPDEETIPSHLSKLLNQREGIDSRVFNFGESGYVSTQELVYLVRKLQTERPPDVVIFYDGFNEALVVASGPRPLGAHHGLIVIGARFESSGEDGSYISAFVRNSGIARASNLIGRSIGINRQKVTPSGSSQITVETTPEEAVELWITNYRLVEALADDFGFLTLFFFQPALTSEAKPWHPSERDIWERATDRQGIGPQLILSKYREMAESLIEKEEDGSLPSGINYIGDVFSEIAEPMFIDIVHVGGTANGIIAEEILGDLIPSICRDFPNGAGSSLREQVETACAN